MPRVQKIKKKISVIIPVLNEEETITWLLQDLALQEVDHEIIVVDGGSTDQTLTVLQRFDVRVIRSEQGRANQMNVGASMAGGDILWFLHADSRVYKNSMEKIIETCEKGHQAGTFYLKFDKKGFWYSFYSKMSQINWSIFTYGDQGIFMTKELFISLKGYRSIPIMEDLDLVLRIKRKSKMEKLNLPVITSARRFEKNGVVWQELKNVVLVLLYLIGISPFFLKRYY